MVGCKPRKAQVKERGREKDTKGCSTQVVYYQAGQPPPPPAQTHTVSFHSKAECLQRNHLKPLCLLGEGRVNDMCTGSIHAIAHWSKLVPWGINSLNLQVMFCSLSRQLLKKQNLCEFGWLDLRARAVVAVTLVSVMQPLKRDEDSQWCQKMQRLLRDLMAVGVLGAITLVLLAGKQGQWPEPKRTRSSLDAGGA